MQITKIKTINTAKHINNHPLTKNTKFNDQHLQNTFKAMLAAKIPLTKHHYHIHLPIIQTNPRTHQKNIVTIQINHDLEHAQLLLKRTQYNTITLIPDALFDENNPVTGPQIKLTRFPHLQKQLIQQQYIQQPTYQQIPLTPQFQQLIIAKLIEHGHITI